MALEDLRTDFVSLNVGGTDDLSVVEFGREVTEVLGRPDLDVELPGLYRFGDTRHVVSDSDALVALGWQRTLGTTDVIQRYAEWAASEPDAHDHLDEALVRMQALGVVRRVHSDHVRTSH